MNPQACPRIRPGDKVAVCATSSPCDPTKLAAGLSLLSKRYRVCLDPHLENRVQSYLAGTDGQRAEELMSAVADPDVRAIFMTRGGYGALRIVDDLDPQALRRDPKPLCGFSDGTVLLNWWLHHGMVAIHGPVVTQMSRLTPQALDHLWRLLEEPDYRPTYIATTGPSMPIQKNRGLHRRLDTVATNDHGRTGLLWGGNLATLTTLLGTPLAHPVSGDSIVVLEDVSEPAYRLDRMMTQMHRGGAFKDVAAAALGSFCPASSTKEADSTRSQDLAIVIADRFDAFGIPASHGFPWGHDRYNRAIALGITAELSGQTLETTTGAVQ